MEYFFLKSIKCDLQQSNLTNGKIYDLMVLFKEGIDVILERHGDLDRFSHEDLYRMLREWLEGELNHL